MLTSALIPCQVNVTKSSGKLGITIPRFAEGGHSDRIVIRLTIANQTGQASFLALAASWITIPTKIRRKLNIAYDSTLSILELKPIKPHSKPTFRTEGDKADMLSLTPDTSTSGYPLYVDEYENEKNREPWLRIWYYHPRGAARQLELRRYVNISKLGEILGLLQAEGDKNPALVAFKNSSLLEHSDFVSSLRELGISCDISARCTFNPKSSYERISEYCETYKKLTGVVISTCDRMDEMKGQIAAYTYVRSTILAQLLMYAMNEVLVGHAQDAVLREKFLAKLLSGDGSLGARKTPKRLDVRLTVVDQNIQSLNGYADLLSREGFKPKVLAARITVRAYCTWFNLLRLYEIGAFRNGKNWVKLLCSIMITMRGRENRGYKRIQELTNQAVISSDDIATNYGIGRRSANLWIHTMRRKGLIEEMSYAQHYGRKSYAISAKGKAMARLIEAIERNYNEIAAERGLDDPETILDQIRTRPRRMCESVGKALIR